MIINSVLERLISNANVDNISSFIMHYHIMSCHVILWKVSQSLLFLSQILNKNAKRKLAIKHGNAREIKYCPR